MNDRAQELIDGLRRRATSCNEVANNYDLRHDSLAAERCRAKARAYEHSAELAQQILGTEPPMHDVADIIQELTHMRDEALRVQQECNMSRALAAARGDLNEASNHDTIAYGRRCVADEIDALLGRVGLFASAKPERDAEYWRMRCYVTERDVNERGITSNQAAAWMEANGFERAYAHRTLVLGTDSIACLCNNVGNQVGKPAQRVLDEMAAIVPETKS